MKCIIKAQFCNQMKSDEIMHIHVTLVEVIKIKQYAISIASTCIPIKSVPTKLFYSLKYSAKFWST